MEPYELPAFGSDDRKRAGNPVTNSELHDQQLSSLFSDLSTWAAHTHIPEPISQPAVGPGSSDPTHFLPGPTSGHQVPIGDTWTDQISGLVPVVRQQSQQALTQVKNMEEDSGIKLVHALLTCAEAIQLGQIQLAALLLDQMTTDLLTRVTTASGIGKVAGYFIEALTRRIYNPNPAQTSGQFGSGLDYEGLYHHFYEACPYLKFSHFTANQAIMEAFDGHDHVHIIDFSLIHGLQWPALIQALALRPGGPPSLKITGIGPASETGSNSLLEVGSKLALLARSVNVRFTFRAVASTRPWMLETNPKEALAVNSIFQLHKLIGSDIDPVLNCIRNLNPKIVTIVEQEANHNQPEFLPRFTEALFYYSTMFDSLDSCPAQPDKALAELYLQREISNILCCEGPERVERHEPLGQWRVRMGRAGFRQLGLGQNAYRQASMLLSLFSAEGYGVEEREGCLRLGWHRRPLITASAWQVGRISQIESPSSVILDGSSSSSSSS